MIKLEMHYINATDSIQPASATTELYGRCTSSSRCNEMCGFFAYYYPVVPAKVCWHSDALATNGFDFSCPGDDAVCSLIQQLCRTKPAQEQLGLRARVLASR